MIYPLTLYSNEHLFSLVSHFNSLYSKWVKKWFISCDSSLAVDIPTESLLLDKKNEIKNKFNIPFYGFDNWNKVLYSSLFEDECSNDQLTHPLCQSILNECLSDLLTVLKVSSLSDIDVEQSNILKFGSGWLTIKLFISENNYFSLLLPSSFIKPILKLPVIKDNKTQLTSRLNTISDKTIILKATCDSISLTVKELNSLRTGDVISLDTLSGNTLFLKSHEKKEVFTCKPCSDKDNKAVYIVDKIL
ncbi:FliM/FliN family flagellar motor switch protein [Zooshikella marina]|uniref:FliM/FliN family flagellar motor switch protein n=1 Tax=Zooshikella ganghwensis TaxID=202772 RepID=UPI001BAEC537|nr:FliM/FliN family flagellar motor switch protein [Zooshikella ganghwensis]MBU2705941.1 FliM/FliN family flagellar motor switch protein [Zooshikella ganghwensis]